MYLASKLICYQPYEIYNHFQSPYISEKTFLWISIIGLPVSTNWKRNSYNPIFVIINYLTKIVHYKPIKVTINAPSLAEVIINVMM